MSTTDDTPDDTRTSSDGEFTAEEVAAADRLADEFGDGPLGRICQRIAQSADPEDSEEANS